MGKFYPEGEMLAPNKRPGASIRPENLNKRPPGRLFGGAFIRKNPVVIKHKK